MPKELIRAISLVGPEGYVKERLAAFREAGATTLVVNPLLPGREARVAQVSKLRELVG